MNAAPPPNYGSLLSAQLHYHASFVLVQRREAEGDWAAFVATLRDWIEQHLERRERLPDNLLPTGGVWHSRISPRTMVQVAVAVGNLETRSWKYWSCRFEHSDSGNAARMWRTDLGAEQLEDGTLAISVTNSHFLRPGYLGELPSDPTPSAPRIVRTLLTSRFWEARAGTEILGLKPIGIGVGEGHLLHRRLVDSERDCPIVFVARLANGALPVNTDQLARLSAGAAAIYQSDNPDLDFELDWFLPKEFRCFRGAIRIFQPRLRLNVIADARRHQYIRPGIMSPAEMEESVVRSVCQLPLARHISGIRTVEDVLHREREAKLAELKQTAPYGSQEWVQLLEEESKELGSRIKALEEANFDLEDRLERTADQLEDSQREVERLSYEKEQIAAQAKGRSESTSQRALDIEELPDSLGEVLILIDTLYPRRLVLTERALRSAREATFRRVGTAWKCLRAMATVLHDLHFELRLPLFEIKKLFRERTGLELAIGESEATMSNRRLAALRELHYNGQVVDISTHVKYGTSPPDCLRIYYHPLESEKRLIIGHCGDHLDTTRTN